jgi:AraC-like DNA-binding protein
MSRESLSSYKLSFDELPNLFTTRSASVSVLDPHVGEGVVHVYNLAKGLQARFWDCTFYHEIEMFTGFGKTDHHRHFTLAFFKNTEGFKFGNSDTSMKDSIIWDTVLISGRSNYKMRIRPNIKGQCLSISFTKNWLCENIFQARTIDKRTINVLLTEAVSLISSMDASEKKMVHELLDFSWKKSFGSFYIKSCVLKIITDFFSRIKERETAGFTEVSLERSMLEVEDYLFSHLTGRLPSLKHLAHRFSLTEPIIKKHFRKKYGENISTYFMLSKLKYGQYLMQQKNMSIKETAALLGYRNVNHFVAMLKKYLGD